MPNLFSFFQSDLNFPGSQSLEKPCLTLYTANMGHMEKSVHSTVNHCNQVYRYSTVFFYISLLLQMQCNNCKPEIQWFNVTSKLLHCTVYNKYLCS